MQENFGICVWMYMFVCVCVCGMEQVRDEAELGFASLHCPAVFITII